MEISSLTFLIISQFCIMTSGSEKVANKTTMKRDFSDFSVWFNDNLSVVDWNSIIVSKVNGVDDQFSSFCKQLN